MAQILLVEDDRAALSMMALVLRKAGHVVVAGVCGPAAMDAIAACNYDIVVSDVFMPELDGVAIVRAVRRVKPQCPIIAISGGCSQVSAYTALTMMGVFGADAFLYKPFPRAELLSAIAAAENRHSRPKLRLVGSRAS
jgi:two-component system, chemotaxis family, chemotaxis protein CheY